MNRPNLISALVIPDSLLAKEATDLLREYSTDLLFNHSIRVYLFAAEQGCQQKLRFDPELLYVAAAFHDLGPIKKFSSETSASRSMVRTRPVSSSPHTTFPKNRYKQWEAIALHTTPGVTQYMCLEVALLY